MQPFLILIVISVVFACKNQQEGPDVPTLKERTYTEAEARKFFEDSISGSEGKEFTSEKFPRFLQKFYPDLKAGTNNALIYAMEEPFIETIQMDTAKHWFRVTVDPCFRRPYSLIVEKSNGESAITIKVTNGFGCQYPGLLVSTSKYRSVGELYDTISTTLKRSNFWTLSDDTTCGGGLDGETWFIEAIDNGKYNAISRWMPQDCGDTTTRGLAKMVRHIARESRLDAILSAIGAPKSGL